MMKSVVSQGTGTGAALSGVQAGGKTGTTSNNYDIWFNGFTPHYAAALWIGTDYNIQLSSDSSGAAALWGRIMNNIAAAKEGSYPSKPADVVQKGSEYYIKGTETNSGSSYNNSSGTSSGKKNTNSKKPDSGSSADNPSTGGSGSGGGNGSGGSSSGGNHNGGNTGGGNTGGGGEEERPGEL